MKMLEKQEMSNSNDFGGHFTFEPEVEIEEENNFLEVSFNGVTIKKEITHPDVDFNPQVQIEELECTKVKDEVQDNYSDNALREEDVELQSGKSDFFEKVNKETETYVRRRWLSLINQAIKFPANDKTFKEVESSLTCRKCLLNFEYESDLAAHEENHSTGVYQCSECNQVFDREISLKVHRSFHLAKKRHKCQLCEKSFTRKASLNDHALSHSGEKPYQCDVCKKYYRSKFSLISHVRYHFKEKKYVCPVCKKLFFQPSALSQHLATHKVAKDYQCDLCKKHFAYKSTLNRHIKSHFAQQRHPCDECGKYFKQTSSLYYHKRSVHQGLRPFKCEDCDKKFSRSYSLKIHMNSHKILQMPNMVEVVHAKN